MNHSVVDVVDLGITRRGTTILQGISFSLAQHQRLAIIGPNGAGKSFLLRVISADLIPSRGTVSILGHVFGKVSLWELRKKIGFVSTRMIYECDRSLSVFEVVCSGFKGTYSLSEEPTEEEGSRAKERIRFFGLCSIEQRKFAVLSDGESRKTLLCRAMVNEPQLLVFDEPCQGLDISTRELLLADIDRLAIEIPLIYVTHHLEELPSCITDVMFIKGGEMKGLGVKDSMLASEALSELFGCPLLVKKKGVRYYVEHDE